MELKDITYHIHVQAYFIQYKQFKRTEFVCEVHISWWFKNYVFVTISQTLILVYIAFSPLFSSK